MAVVQIDVTLSDGTEKNYTFDPDEVTLGFLEDLEHAQETKKLRDIMPIIAQFLGMSRDEARQIKNRDWQAIQHAMVAATNGVNPTSA